MVNEGKSDLMRGILTVNECIWGILTMNKWGILMVISCAFLDSFLDSLFYSNVYKYIFVT